MNVGLLRSFLNVLLGDDAAVVSILNVLSNGAIKQEAPETPAPSACAAMPG